MNKFFWIGLAIYLAPGLVFWGWVFATMPETDWSHANPFMLPIFLGFFIITVLGFPIMNVYLLFYMVPMAIVVSFYLVVSYGLLYLWMRKSYREKGKLLIDRARRRLEEKEWNFPF